MMMSGGGRCPGGKCPRFAETRVGGGVRRHTARDLRSPQRRPRTVRRSFH